MSFDPDPQFFAPSDLNAGDLPAFDPSSSPLQQLLARLGQQPGQAGYPGVGVPDQGGAQGSATDQIRALMSSPAPPMVDPGMNAGLPTATPPAAPVSPTAAAPPVQSVADRLKAVIARGPHSDHHDNRLIQAFGVLSALAGGPGARIGGAIIQRQQQQDQEDQQRQQQQANAGLQFLTTLGSMGAATQEATVRNLTAAQMQSYGFTPDQVQSQFFDAAGKFKPVTAADKATDPAALAKTQTTARASLYQLTPADQQAWHDSFAPMPEKFTEQTGLPYDGFTPGQTVKAVQGDRKLGQGDTRLTQRATAEQDAQWKTFLSMSPALQKSEIAAYADRPEEAEAKYGRPFASIQAGQTDANLIQSTAVTHRETDAQRTADIARLSQKDRSAYQARMLQLKAKGLTIQQSHDRALEEIARQNANTSSSRLRFDETKPATGGAAARIRNLMSGAGSVSSFQSTINQANAAKNRILTGAQDKDGSMLPLTPFQQSVIDTQDQIITEAQHGQRALARGVNPVTGQPLSYVTDPRTGRPAIGPDGQLVTPLSPAPIQFTPMAVPAAIARAKAKLRAATGGSRVPAPAASAGPLPPDRRAKMSNQAFARYFTQRMIRKMGGN